MFLQILVYHFLFSALTTHPPVAFELGLQRSQPVTAAGFDGMELIEGYDDYTGQAYSHSLPLVEDTGVGPMRIDSNSLGLLTSAESILVVDRRTKKVLYEQGSTQQRSIASITKMMTALVLQDQDLNFNQVVTISPADKIDGGRIWVYSGEEFLVQDLWMAGLVASDNVAIRALVRHTGLSYEEFAAAMNQKAKNLGMDDSIFIEPTGIHSGNKSTAHDLMLLFDEAFNNVQIADAVRRPVYTFSPLNKESLRTIENTNKLLSSYLNKEPYHLVGGKTGFTYEAGYCLGVIADGNENNDEIIAVVLGSDTIQSRFQEIKGIVDWVYRNFRW